MQDLEQVATNHNTAYTQAHAHTNARLVRTNQPRQSGNQLQPAESHSSIWQVLAWKPCKVSLHGSSHSGRRNINQSVDTQRHKGRVVGSELQRSAIGMDNKTKCASSIFHRDHSGYQVCLFCFFQKEKWCSQCHHHTE